MNINWGTWGRSDAFKELLKNAPMPEPHQMHFPLRLTELEFIEFAHIYDSLGIDVDKILKIKVKKFGPHRMFIIKGLRYP